MLGVYDKGKAGTVVETETVLVEKGRGDGERFVRMLGSAFFVGQGGWGGPKGRLVILAPLWEDEETEEMRGGRRNGPLTVMDRAKYGELSAAGGEEGRCEV